MICYDMIMISVWSW